MCELKSGQALWIGNAFNFVLTNTRKLQSLMENLVEMRIDQNGEELIYANSKNIVDYFETINLNVVGIKVKKN